MWLSSGIGIVVKAVWDAITAWGTWIGENPRMTAALSTLLLVFAGLTASITGTTVALGGMAALMKSMGKKSALLIALLAVWYLFQEYDKYLKGEDTWMTAFQRKIAEMTIDVRLFRAELGLMWEQLKNGEFGNAINNPSVKTTGEKILDEIIPKSWRDGVDSLKERNNRNKQMLEDYRNKGVIPHRSSAKGVSDTTQIEGYVNVAVNLKYPNGALETVKINAPVRNINTGGLLTG